MFKVTKMTNLQYLRNEKLEYLDFWSVHRSPSYGTYVNQLLQTIFFIWKMKGLVIMFSFINWDSLHARLKSHYKAWSYNKKKKKIPSMMNEGLERGSKC